MDNVTDAYLDYIKDCAMQFPAPPTVACEVKVNFSGYVPDGFGTADLVMIGGNKLRVIDFKYGKGVPVEVTDNAQMKLYALGALAQYALLYKVERVILSIAQLRLGEPAEWETTPDELYQVGIRVCPAESAAGVQRRGRVPRRRPLPVLPGKGKVPRLRRGKHGRHRAAHAGRGSCAADR